MTRIMIVGASSGIGKELARVLAGQDISVVAISRNHPDAPIHRHIPYDLCSDDELPALEGALDGLVYCPGSILLRPFKLLKDQDFRDDLEINLFGAIRVIRHFLPLLVLAGRASIVLFSSVAARVGMPYHSSIAVSKAAIEGLTVSLAAELAPAIRVNAIAPSLVRTPLSERLTDSEAKVRAAADRHALKRIGDAADIAAMAAFLLSENAAWITGQILHVDGGMSSLKV